MLRILLLNARLVRWLRNHNMFRNKNAIPVLILKLCVEQYIGVQQCDLTTNPPLTLADPKNEATASVRSGYFVARRVLAEIIVDRC